MPPVSRPVSPEAQSIIKKALEKLRAQRVTQDYCPRCSTFDWNVDLLAIPAISLPNPEFKPHLVPQTGYMRLLGFVCKNCGYTMFHNLDMLDIPTE